MENLLQSFVFKLGEWQNIKALLMHVKKHGKTSDDIIAYVDGLVSAKAKSPTYKLDCPDCNKLMSLLSVNHHPSAMTDDPTDQ